MLRVQLTQLTIWDCMKREREYCLNVWKAIGNLFNFGKSHLSLFESLNSLPHAHCAQCCQNIFQLHSTTARRADILCIGFACRFSSTSSTFFPYQPPLPWITPCPLLHYSFALLACGTLFCSCRICRSSACYWYCCWLILLLLLLLFLLLLTYIYLTIFVCAHFLFPFCSFFGFWFAICRSSFVVRRHSMPCTRILLLQHNLGKVAKSFCLCSWSASLYIRDLFAIKEKTKNVLQFLLSLQWTVPNIIIDYRLMN